MSRAVCHDIIKLNKKLETVSFGAAQVNRQAFDKKYLSAKDFGRDFMKAGNCHAAFALSRDADEKATGYGRLEPIVQRMGVSVGKNRSVNLHIDESRMLVEEVAMVEIKEKADRAKKKIEDD